MSGLAALVTRLRTRYHQLDLGQLNHILIPATAAERDRFRRGRLGRLAGRAFAFYEAFSREGHAALLVLFAAALAGLFDTAHSDAYLLWCGLAAMFAVSLAARRTYTLPGVTLSVTGPARVRLGQPLTLTLSLDNPGALPLAAVRLEGPFLPWDGTYLGSPPTVARVPPRGRAAVTLQCRFRARGEHHLDTFRAAALGPFGLTLGPSLRSGTLRFLVVPALTPVTLSPDEAAPARGHAAQTSSLRGDATMDLRGVRPYRPGDPARDLHARSSARLGVPMVREYEHPTRRRAVVYLHTDAEPGFTRARFESAVSLCAGLVDALQRADVAVTALCFGHGVHGIAAAPEGAPPACLDPCLDLLACVAPPGLRDLPADPRRLVDALRPHLDGVTAAHLVALDASPNLRTVGAALAALGLTVRMHHP